ncbi:MAG TPA: hypothetical protein VFA20_13720 [Myxococcaceae bacterium]|nr:hypothetical protein [Myxococcaceae bacterium]
MSAPGLAHDCGGRGPAASGKSLAARWLLAFAAAVTVAVAPGCKCSRSGTQDAAEDRDRVRPNYDLTGPEDPLAAKLCDALYKMPEARRAQCCPGGPTTAINLATKCTPMLSAALRLGGVKLAPEAADKCIAALGAAYQGCAWVGPNPVPLPAACLGVLTGTLAEGAQCRSSLECQGTLLCAGVGPTDLGKCTPARPPGGHCATAVDALASYTRQDAPALHPECDGFCLRHVCRSPMGPGGQCVLDSQCKSGQHCAKEACIDGPVAKLGEACSAGGCEAPLRCIKDTCRAPAPDGAPCGSHLDCTGACIPGDAGSQCGSGCAFR